MDDFIVAVAESKNSELAAIKRFLERLIAQPKLKEKLRSNPDTALPELELDAAPLRYLWDREYRETLEAELGEEQALKIQPDMVKAYVRFRSTKAAYAEHIREESEPLNLAFAAWRRRQIERCSTELDLEYQEAIAHLTFAAELSVGCSGGCSFCGLNAPKLKTNYLYTEANAVKWRQVLSVLNEITGKKAGRWGFLYWATDPFDNPDYEKFCQDFAAEFGIFPHTTTTQALRDVDRTHRFLALAQDSGCYHNRFSVLSLSMLNRIYKEFSADALFYTDLVLQNQEASTIRVSSGRATETKYNEQSGQTIACLTGFLINMEESTVKLVSPCSPSSKWPLGYRVFAEAAFSDGNSLRDALKEIIAAYMTPLMPMDRVLAFRSDLKCTIRNDGFSVSSTFGAREFTGSFFLAETGVLINEGEYTAAEIVSYFASKGISEEISAEWLRVIFENGVLDEDRFLDI